MRVFKFRAMYKTATRSIFSEQLTITKRRYTTNYRAMEEIYEYAYSDQNDLINKKYLFNKGLKKIIKRYNTFSYVNLSFEKNNDTKTIKLINASLANYTEEVRNEIVDLFKEVYNKYS